MSAAWKVHVEPQAGRVEVYPEKDQSYQVEWVPAWSSKRTVRSGTRNFDRKLDKIVQRCQRWCDNQNRMERRLESADDGTGS